MYIEYRELKLFWEKNVEELKFHHMTIKQAEIYLMNCILIHILKVCVWAHWNNSNETSFKVLVHGTISFWYWFRKMEFWL